MERLDMAKLRTRLLLDQPFFGTLAYHLEVIEDRSIETLCTNGTWLKVNPDYMAKLTGAEQLGVLAHEVMHPALGHPWRTAGRDLTEWNEACDFAVNDLLLKAGFTLPEGVLIDPQFAGMSADQIYSKRRSMQPPPPQEPEEGQDQEDEAGEEEQPGDDAPGDQGDQDEDGSGSDGTDQEGDGEGEQDGGEGDGQSDSSMPGCPTGEFVPGAVTEEEPGDLTEATWETIAAEAALVGQRAGDLPGGVEQAIKESREPQIDWKAELQAFITQTVATQQSWATPNRRMIAHGLYLPGDKKENVGEIVVAVDTSGSTWQLLEPFAAEVSGLIREVQPERVHVIHCDTAIQKVDVYTPEDNDVQLTVKGMGGTAFQPVFDYVEENGLEPLALIYLTDLEGPTPVEPRYPVLWVTPMHSSYPAPFGQLVRMP